MRVTGAGTCIKRGEKTWRIRHALGKDPISNEYRYSPWRTIYGTKAAAREALIDYKHELESGLRLDADKVTFSAFAELYCSRRAATGGLSPSTLRLDTQQTAILNKYLADAILRDIDATTIQILFAKLGEEGKSASAIKRAFTILKKIMKEAVNNDLILRSPCDRVDAPKTTKPEITFLDTSEVTRFLAALDKAAIDTRCRNRSDDKRSVFQAAHVMACRLALATGARRGEVLGLCWGTVDLRAKTMRITQQMTLDGLRPPKTERGRRVVSLGNDIVSRLEVWKPVQAEYLLALGIRQDGQTPVITDELGGFQDPSNFADWWRDFRDEYGFTGLKFHHLRHTQATLLIGENVDIKTVQARLGHTLASTTLDLYSGVMPGKDKEAAEIVDAIMTAPAPESGKIVNL
jgi:integrase